MNVENGVDKAIFQAIYLDISDKKTIRTKEQYDVFVTIQI